MNGQSSYNYNIRLVLAVAQIGFWDEQNRAAKFSRKSLCLCDYLKQYHRNHFDHFFRKVMPKNERATWGESGLIR